MKCEACGGDGLIEVGAYRGDESDTTTRECRLCGGVAADSPLENLTYTALSSGLSVSQVVERLPRLLESVSGSRRVVEVAIPIPASSVKMTQNTHGFYESREPVPLPTRSSNTEEIRFERTTSARNADEEMNKFLRDNFQD